MEKIFKLKENGTTVRTEIVAGLTTFMTMAYIIALNPNLLTGFAVGTPLWNGVFMATCIASAIGMLVMAFAANKPFAMAPGMGLNSFFAVVVANIAALSGLSYEEAFPAAMCIILVEGIFFVVLTMFSIREKIVEAIPFGIRIGITPAIGLMLLNIGFGSNAGIYSEKGGPFFVLSTFFGSLTPSVARDTVGSAYPQLVLYVVTMLIGVFAIVILSHRKVKASVILGMLISCIVYWGGSFIFLDTNPFESLATASFVPPLGDMLDTTFLKFDFKTFISIGWFTAVALIITFCMIDMFDTIGTLVGTAARANMLDKDGKMPNMKQALMADAVGTVAGACTGTSTVTTFIESGSGVEAGGRTGLTAMTTGVLFLLATIFSPLFLTIPSFATAPALIIVGFYMMGSAIKIDFNDPSEGIPAFLTILAMPTAYSISEGIAIGIISWTIINVITGKAKEKKISPLMYVLTVLFILKYVCL